ncbi:MAG TPA: aminotransferase class V-fold PLP-dependent enzyme [Solirubrobacteraceae bacterium]|nr:aminotransferase class V-fold PLP-dependent enzyme [Solirubrobacteraceae bacterium]
MIKSQERAGRERAVELDAADPLGVFRERFFFGDDGAFGAGRASKGHGRPQAPTHPIYLDGNSLGRLPVATLQRLERVVGSEWGVGLIGSWSEGWMDLPVTVGDRLASVALGAAPGQVVVGDSTTVCLYKLASAALDARPGRTEILTDADNFPTDRYVLEGLARARGLELRWLRGDPAAGPTPSDVSALISSRTALVSFSHVSYRSAHIAEMAQINALAHAAGALTLWDLSHSAGSVPIALDDDAADLAVGCTYKYLCGGPGAPAYMYVRRELQERLRQPIWGWLGRLDAFEMEPGYVPAAGIRGWLSGTPPVLALAAVDEGARLVGEAGIGAIREKGVALTELAISLADERLAGFDVRVASPRDSGRRGAHVAVAHPDARRLCAELGARGVIVDFRAPDVIRLGLSPLTTRFIDVWDGVDVLQSLLARA